jgi:hypothetical protein
MRRMAFSTPLMGLLGIAISFSGCKDKLPDLPAITVQGKAATDVKLSKWKVATNEVIDGMFTRVGPGSASDSEPRKFDVQYTIYDKGGTVVMDQFSFRTSSLRTGESTPIKLMLVGLHGGSTNFADAGRVQIIVDRWD